MTINMAVFNMENEAMSEANEAMKLPEANDVESATEDIKAIDQVSPPPTSVAELLSKSADQIKSEAANEVVIDEFVIGELCKAIKTGKWLFMIARVEDGKIFADWKTNNFPGCGGCLLTICWTKYVNSERSGETSDENNRSIRMWSNRLLVSITGSQRSKLRPAK